ncbi:MAG: Fur family transcriptional regulator [Pseudomonadota bacterium]
MGKRGEKMQAEVLDALKVSEAPMSAYEILAALRGAHPKIAPTTVYRALKALLEHGRIHRLESLNAYMTCQHLHTDDAAHPHQSVLSICDDCGAVDESEAPELLASLGDMLVKTGFQPQRHVIEVHGRCADCGPERSVR